MWDRLVRMLGVHTVLVLVERARWIAKEQYNEAIHISFDESGISFAELETQGDPGRVQATASEFVTSLMSIMTRLVGIEISKRIALELDQVSICEDC
jgi:hypothetical protein